MRGLIVWLSVAGCASATIEPGTYTLVGARASTGEDMEPWSGAPVTLEVSPEAVLLTGDGVDASVTLDQWPRGDWVDGCWTLRRSTDQEVWTLSCDAPITLGDPIVAPCPVALIAACPDGRTLLIRDVPEPGGSTTGCGESDLCVQFEPSAR